MKNKLSQRKSSRKSRRSTRKSSRKSRRSTRKTSRKSRRSTRKSSRKSRRSTRKSSRKSRRSNRKSSRKSRRSTRKSSRKSKKSLKKKSVKKSSKKKSSKKKKYTEEEKLILKHLKKILSKIKNLNTTNIKDIRKELKKDLVDLDLKPYKDFIKDEMTIWVNEWIIKKIKSNIPKIIKKKDLEKFTFKELREELEKKLDISLGNNYNDYIKEEVRQYI